MPGQQQGRREPASSEQRTHSAHQETAGPDTGCSRLTGKRWRAIVLEPAAQRPANGSGDIRGFEVSAVAAFWAELLEREVLAHVSLGDPPLVDEPGAANLIKPLGLFFPVASP